MMPPTTAIVILNWNGWKDTIECLESLCLLDYPRLAVIVVDNASSDESALRLCEWTKQHTARFHSIQSIQESEVPQFSRPLEVNEYLYLQAASNGGFAQGNNLAIRVALQAGCDFVWLLNNDTVVTPNALSALVDKMQSAPNIGMCGSVLRYYDDPSKIQAIGGARFNFNRARGEQIGFGYTYDDECLNRYTDVIPDYVAGASMLLSVDFVKDVGLMEESYFLYFEELDWAIRAAPKWKLATALDSMVLHKEGQSIGTASRSQRSGVSQYYLIRNLIRLYFLRVPHRLPIAVFRACFESAKLLLKGDTHLALLSMKAVKDGMLNRSGSKQFN